MFEDHGKAFLSKLTRADLRLAILCGLEAAKEAHEASKLHGVSYNPPLGTMLEAVEHYLATGDRTKCLSAANNPAISANCWTDSERFANQAAFSLSNAISTGYGSDFVLYCFTYSVSAVYHSKVGNGPILSSFRPELFGEISRSMLGRLHRVVWPVTKIGRASLSRVRPEIAVAWDQVADLDVETIRALDLVAALELAEARGWRWSTKITRAIAEREVLAAAISPIRLNFPSDTI